MSGREWKPGDVARVTIASRLNGGVSEYIALNVGAFGWHGVSAGEGAGRLTDNEEAFRIERRPLVVIDPEDHEQVVRLATLYNAATVDYTIGARPLADALREFATPTPPKPDEPIGLGAVVEGAAYTDDVRRFVRVSDRAPAVWMDDESNCRHDWAEIDVVRVLSEGWTA